MERDHVRCIAPLAARGIEPIADDRMADAREVRANLVRPPSLEGQLEQRPLAGAVDSPVASDRMLAALLECDDRAAVVTGWIAAERRVDRAGLGVDAPVDHRAITPVDSVFGKLPAHVIVYRRVLRDRDEATRRAIEAMERSRTPAAPGSIRARSTVPEQRVEQRVLAMRSEGVHVHAGRFVADEERVILVTNDERHALRDKCRGGERGVIEPDTSPCKPDRRCGRAGR